MNHKTDMREALQLCIDVMLHDGVPTDPYHPRRVALAAAEAALAARPDAQADERGAKGYSKEWCMRMAALEPDDGIPPASIAASAPTLGESTDEQAAFEAWWNANETWPVAAKNLALLAWTTRANKPQPQAAEPKQTPFDNCQFRICDLPGQCRAEGKCHHPAAQAAEPKGLTDEQIKQAATATCFARTAAGGWIFSPNTIGAFARALLANGE